MELLTNSTHLRSFLHLQRFFFSIRGLRVFSKSDRVWDPAAVHRDGGFGERSQESDYSHILVVVVAAAVFKGFVKF